MKKKILTAAAIIIVLLFSFIGYLWLRQKNSYNHVVHKQADVIIKINSDKILQSLIWDYLIRPADISFKKKGKGIKSGIEISANFFVYTLSNESSDTFFCRLKVSDSEQFKEFARKRLGVQSFKKVKHTDFGTSENGRLSVVLSHDAAAIAFSLKKENVTDVLLEIVEGRNLLDGADQRFNKLKEADAHISFIQKDAYGQLNFNAGEIRFNATIPFLNDFIPAQVVEHSHFPKESSVKMWLGGKFNVNNCPNITVKEFNFNADSLFKPYKGYIEASLTGTAIQQDTAINYEYTDDFEKVETINIVDKQVPKISVSIKSDTQQLFDYLHNQQIVTQQRLLNKKLFPLYDFYISTNREYFQLSTAQNSNVNKPVERSNLFFYLWTDFKRLKHEKHFPLINKYIDKLDLFEVKAQKDKNCMIFSGSLNFLDKERNAFRQIKSFLDI